MRGTTADESSSEHDGASRKSRIAKSVLIVGLLLAVIGASGISSLSLPESGTALLTSETYVKLDGRYFGHISGSYSSSRDADIGFCVLDQHDWDIGRSDTILVSYSNHGELTEFSASLTSSQAYYLYFFSVTPLPNQTSSNGYGPVVVEIHWHIWGPTIDFGAAYTAILLLGIVFVLYGDYAGQNRLGGAIYGGWKRKGV